MVMRILSALLLAAMASQSFAAIVITTRVPVAAPRPVAATRPVAAPRPVVTAKPTVTAKKASTYKPVPRVPVYIPPVPISKCYKNKDCK